ncbi:MAG: hypothetical protein DRQ54_10870 [Gammaproteobacteria bacterium]|nr:MAG: hypothetical protein DRQ54_10870 [Gammaproteobacteria bacterium]
MKRKTKQKTMEMPAIQRELSTRYSHVWKKIVENWGSLACPLHLSKLTIVEPSRDRAGFTPKAMEEIFTLIALHDRLFPHHSIEPEKLNTDAWRSYSNK